MTFKEFWKQNRFGFFVSCGVVSLGALIISAKDNNAIPTDFFYWLPFTWLLVFIMMCIVGLIVGGRE